MGGREVKGRSELLRPPFTTGFSDRLVSFRFSGARFGPVGRPDSAAARPLNWPGRGLAATSGRPWFTEASKVRFELAAEADPVCRSGVDDGRVVSVAHDCDVYVGHRAVVVVGAVSPVAAEEADHLSAGRIFVPRSNLYRIAKLPGASGVDASAA